jgi:hypothetical protein
MKPSDEFANNVNCKAKGIYGHIPVAVQQEMYWNKVMGELLGL